VRLTVDLRADDRRVLRLTGVFRAALFFLRLTVERRALERLFFVAFVLFVLRMATPWDPAFLRSPRASRGLRRRAGRRRRFVVLVADLPPRRAAERLRTISANFALAASCFAVGAEFLRMGAFLDARVSRRARASRAFLLRPPIAFLGLEPERRRKAPRPLMAAIAVTPGFGVVLARA
jgi:hypothetical protein